MTKTITCAEIIKRKTKVKKDIGSMMLLYMDVLVHLQRTCSPALLLQSYGLKLFPEPLTDILLKQNN